ncbi:HMI1 [Candida margitis]|uniref:HMI1 n=1 Tax=Candida margitis TaxID=1775924 RepID=UPI002226BB08|nr:HMI1 [Candida margitis]KAI5963924.1 HMI1 [Candida margitis]
MLTPSQQKAVDYDYEPGTVLSIQSGPGCGKTLALINRIRRLLEEGVSPSEIIVLSMTNRTVNLLQKALSEIIKDELVQDVVIKTFHSFAAQIFDENFSKYFPGRPPNSVVDDSTWKSFAKFFSAKHKDLDAAVLAVNSGAPLGSVASKYSISRDQLERTMEYLEDNGMIRFHGLITNAIEVFSESNGALPLADAKVVIIDEFQDMQPILLKFIKQIAVYGRRKHVTLAGDKNQCIYDFLGSRPGITEEFIHDLKFKHTEIVLKETFRLSPEILAVANEIIPSELTSVKREGVSPIRQGDLCTDIVELITISGGLIKFSDIIILTFTNREVEQFAEELTTRYGIKCNKFSGHSWINSKVHIYLDFLHILRRSYGSDFALLFVLEKMGVRNIKGLFAKYNEWNCSKQNRLEDYLRENSSNTLVGEFLCLIENERQGLDTPISILSSLGRISIQTGLVGTVKPDEVSAFYTSLKLSYRRYLADPRGTFLEYFLMHYYDDEPVFEEDRVNVSTIHKAKGLEFPVSKVFVVCRSRDF